MSQEFTISPNPSEEIVAIGLQGIDGDTAAVDRIVINTVTIPEPATLALLTLGGLALLRKRN